MYPRRVGRRLDAAPKTDNHLYSCPAPIGLSPPSRPGQNNPLGQAHSPAIELRLKIALLAGLPPSLRFGAP
jgi:hypothetical protein